MELLSYISLSIALILWGMQLWLRPLLVKKITTLSLMSIGTIAITICYQTHQLLIIWQKSEPPIRYLAPPYAPLSYLLKTAWLQYANGYAISLLIAIFVLLIIKLITRNENRFFEHDEPTLIALCIFLCSNPLWIAFVSIVLICYLCIGIILRAQKKTHPVSIYKYWLPITALTILCSKIILQIHLLAVLRLYGG